MEPYAGFHKGLSIKVAVPKWCCPYCCEPVGYIGNWLALIFGTQFHGCTFENVRTTPDLQKWISKTPKPAEGEMK